MHIQNKDLLNLLPKRYHVPLRFHITKLRARLEPEIYYLNSLVGSAKRAIDVGASRGLYTYALAELCEAVEVFEPQNWAFETIAALGRKNVTCHNVGLSNFSGSLTLNIPLQSGQQVDACASFRELTGQYDSITVPVRKLDDYNFQDVSFIKIDVEGYESEVIEGASMTLSTQKPVLLVEIEQRHLGAKRIDTVFNHILKFGYTGSFLIDNQRVPLSQFSYEMYQEPYLDEIILNGHSNRYINNFIFEPVRFER
jgi:FkbM family methyltransferase